VSNGLNAESLYCLLLHGLYVMTDESATAVRVTS
jgi:hypothetical protein